VSETPGTMRIFDKQGWENERLKFKVSFLTAELTEAKRRIGELEAGLRRMADPIVALLNETPRGHVFDGEAAARIVDNPHWYRDAARALLSNEKGGE